MVSYFLLLRFSRCFDSVNSDQNCVIKKTLLSSSCQRFSKRTISKKRPFYKLCKPPAGSSYAFVKTESELREYHESFLDPHCVRYRREHINVLKHEGSFYNDENHATLFSVRETISNERKVLYMVPSGFHKR